MEVKILHCDNVPPHALLSLRAGTTRRQAHAVKDQRFKFPVGQEKMSDPLKVDILCPVGGMRLSLKPGQDTYAVPVQCTDGRIVDLTLEITGAIVDGAVTGTKDPKAAEKEKPGTMTSPDSNLGLGLDKKKDEKASRRHLAALEAREYLDNHKVLQVVQTLLQDIVREKPTDPWNYFVDHVKESVSSVAQSEVKGAIGGSYFATPETSPEKGILPSTEEAPTAAFVPPNREASPAAVPANADQPAQVGRGLILDSHFAVPPATTTDQGDLSKICDQARQGLETAAEDGSLALIVKPQNLPEADVADAESLKALRNNTRAGLEKMAQEGNLSELLVGDKEEAKPDLNDVRQKARTSLDKGVTDGSLENIMAPKEEAKPDLNDVRQKARTSLDKGVTDGSLVNAMGAGGNADDNSIETLRLKAQKCFEEGVQQGAFDVTAKPGSTSEELNALRSKAQECLSAAVDNNVVPGDAKESSARPLSREENTVRDKARSSLKQGLNTGVLENSLAEVAQPSLAAPVGSTADITSLRDRTKAAFEAKVDDGSLIDILQSGSSPETGTTNQSDSDLNALREKTKQSLEAGANDGTLLQTLSPQEPVKQGVNIKEVREKTRNSLDKGVSDGSLVKVMGGTKESEEAKPNIDEVRQKTRNSLDKGVSDGSLVKVMGGTKESEEAKPAEMDVEALRKKTQKALDRGITDPSLIHGEVKDPMMKVRKESKEAVLEGCKNGQLSKALESSRKEKPASEGKPAEAKASAKPNINEVRQKTRNSLDKGISDGSLVKVMEDDVREKTKNTTDQAISDGSLEKVVGGTKESEEAKPNINEVREKTRNSLDKGVSDGSLVKVMGGTKESEEAKPAGGTEESAEAKPNINEVREKTRNSLDKGVSDGSLVKVMGGTKESEEAKPNIDEVRQKTRNSLDKGVSDGSLVKAMDGGKSCPLPPDEKPPQPPAPQAQPKDTSVSDAESLLVKAQEDLSSIMGDDFAKGSTGTTQASDGDLKEDAQKWVENQPAVGILRNEVNSIRELNEEARAENDQLREQNLELQKQLARLLALEASWDGTRDPANLSLSSS